MSGTSIYDNFIEWYTSEQLHFHQFAEYVLESVSTLLPEYKILTAIESAREKDIESLSKKCKKMVKSNNDPDTYVYKYTDPKNQITDMAGVRIVAYVTSDIPIICSIVKRLFEIDEKNSDDKRSKLESDKVGYLSIHYIVSLKQSDLEYNKYKDMKCEIQVRTVLQHAWAQIFHDRQYKPISEEQIPIDLVRQTNLIAGSLEILDSEIDGLVKRYNEFYKIFDNDRYQALLDEAVSDKSLKEFLFFSMGRKYRFYDHRRVLSILKTLGMETIRDFEHIFKEEIAIAMRDKPAIMIDRIVIFMIVASMPEKFFECFGSQFIFTRSAVDLLKKYIDVDKYIPQCIEE